MLPAPKRKVAIGTKAQPLGVNKAMAKPVAVKPRATLPAPAGYVEDDEDEDAEDQALGSVQAVPRASDTGLLLPASVKRGQVKAARKEDKEVELDLFGLGECLSYLLSWHLTAHSQMRRFLEAGGRQGRRQGRAPKLARGYCVPDLPCHPG